MKTSRFCIRISFFASLSAALLLWPSVLIAKESLTEIGVAKIDITPDYPIRLCGYAVRKKESEGVAQHLWAKAFAIGSDKEGPAILITVDNTGVPASIRNEVAQRLLKKGIKPERIALCSSHSHTAPCLAGNLPTLFGEPIPPDHQAHVERYTRELIDALEKVALNALKSREPAKLSWGQGSAGFAANRRTKGGPVDRDLPVLFVSDAKDKLRAILANYACHCTTLGGETNFVCGDWAGYAQEYLERDHPGAIALMAIGCGADANPQPGGNIELAKKHGAEIESAVNQLLGHTLTPIRGKLECRTKPIELPFDTLPTREEWEQKAQQTNYVGYHARVNLAKLDRGEQIPTKLPYMVQAWNFGDELGMIFLPGEVVVDYSLRLKKEFDPAHLWVTAYANDVPCYIPSERILKEGGYEGGGAMIYYDKPTRLAPGIENLIANAVHDIVPKSFVFDEKRAEFPPPKSPEESLSVMQTKAGFEIELAAAEPLIVDPVAIDWGADGKLWVVEMRDYPMGMDGKWKPGSRVKFLEDTNGDGKYDKATVFVDNLPFATGVMAWRKGVLICAAPDILYAEEVGQGRDRHVRVQKILTGFVTENYQARVNSLSLGLDNWIYGANGLLGGIIHGESRGLSSVDSAARAASGEGQVDIRGRDFRVNPDSGAFEPASGLTQQGRIRDDWGNWFGCDNSTIAWHYPLPDHYVRRNPYVTAPSPRVSIAAGENPNLLHPISRTLERFNQPQSANHVTSGCGLGIYRDDLLGSEFYGNAFLCEPVHNLVHRLVLQPNGLTFSGARPSDEQQSEFLASRDNWFRPVQARTGPDGALWVVDMYRFVIEHPRWIPAERLVKLDVRAGDDKGRIYRVVLIDKKLRPIRDLTKFSTARLVAALDTPNGTERDRIHQELVFSAMDRPHDQLAIVTLEKLAHASKLSTVRVQALCVLDGLGALKPEAVTRALSDGDPNVRANAVRLCERFPNASAFSGTLPKLVDDPDIHVRFQLALSLGEWNERWATDALGNLAKRDAGDSWMRAAILSSAARQPAEILKGVLTLESTQPGRTEMIRQLIATAVGASDSVSLAKLAAEIAPTDQQHLESWQLSALNSLLDALDRKNISLSKLSQTNTDMQPLVARLDFLFDWSRKLVANSETKDALREPAIHLLGREPEKQSDDLKLLANLVDQPLSTRSQAAVFDSLKRLRNPDVPQTILAGWKQRAPSLRQSTIDILFSRDDWMNALLDNVENGTVAASEISPANRQRLLKHSNHALQKRAETIWSGQNGSRAEIIAKYQSATTLTGDSAKGATVFANTCATCHFLRGQGHAVGPNLAALADKTPADFLTAILDPNAVVEPRFVAYNIETKDGRSLSGIVSAETATTLTLVQGGGGQETVLRSDIQEMRASGLSLMPEGLEQNMMPQDLANLIAYLKTSPRVFGTASVEQAEQEKKIFLITGCNGLGKILAAADRLPYPSWLGTLPMPFCRQSQDQSRLAWQTTPVPADLNSNAAYQFRLAAGMGFISQPSGNFQLRLNDKPILEFNVATTDQSWQSADGKIKMSYTVMENNPEDSNGVLLIEVANSLLAPGKRANFEVIGSSSNSQRWFGLYLVTPAMAQATQ
jgi:putative membrane-bound dehydrogenase-like protein